MWNDQNFPKFHLTKKISKNKILLFNFYTFYTSRHSNKVPLYIPIPMAELGDFLLGSMEADVRTLLHKINIHLLLNNRPIFLG